VEKGLVDMDLESVHDNDPRRAGLVFVSGMSVQKESVKGAVARCRAAEVRKSV